MAMRKIQFQNDYFYHIYNRGTDKREIFMDKKDYLRLFKCLKEFNRPDPIGSIFLKDYLDKKAVKEPNSSKFEELGSLIEIIAYCFLPNHYHILVKELKENGISKFMHKLGISFTNYFNSKYNRSGALFQGKYKFKQIETDEYLVYLSAYINGNPEIHKVSKAENWPWSSYQDYLGKRKGTLCNKNVILKDFKSTKKYRNYVNDVIKNSQDIKKEIKKCLLE